MCVIQISVLTHYTIPCTLLPVIIDSNYIVVWNCFYATGYFPAPCRYLMMMVLLLLGKFLSLLTSILINNHQLIHVLPKQDLLQICPIGLFFIF